MSFSFPTFNLLSCLIELSVLILALLASVTYLCCWLPPPPSFFNPSSALGYPFPFSSGNQLPPLSPIWTLPTPNTCSVQHSSQLLCASFQALLQKGRQFWGLVWLLIYGWLSLLPGLLILLRDSQAPSSNPSWCLWNPNTMGNETVEAHSLDFLLFEDVLVYSPIPLWSSPA